MAVKELPIVKIDPEEFERIEKALKDLFLKEIYLPLIKALGLNRKSLQNSADDLLAAIRSGQIQFYRGKFTGKFTAEISRELRILGAEWNKKTVSFDIRESFLSSDIKIALSASEDRFKRTLQKVDDKLQQILPEDIADKLKIEELFDSTLFRVNKKLQKTLEGITVSPTLTDEQRARIATEYTNNMRLYIKDWTKKEIKKLRADVQGHVFAGNRYEALATKIQDSYDVSKSKAKFLARQETNLMLSKFKETRYEDAGVTKYKWTCVAGSTRHPVRPMHKKLDGKVFSFHTPPIVNEKGDRKNPGEDYGCRCFARPIVQF